MSIYLIIFPLNGEVQHIQQRWDRFGLEPNRTEPNRTETGSVRDFQKLDRFGSVRFEIFSVRFGSVREKREPIPSKSDILITLISLCVSSDSVRFGSVRSEIISVRFGSVREF